MQPADSHTSIAKLVEEKILFPSTRWPRPEKQAIDKDSNTTTYAWNLYPRFDSAAQRCWLSPPFSLRNTSERIEERHTHTQFLLIASILFCASVCLRWLNLEAFSLSFPSVLTGPDHDGENASIKSLTRRNRWWERRRARETTRKGEEKKKRINTSFHRVNAHLSSYQSAADRPFAECVERWFSTLVSTSRTIYFKWLTCSSRYFTQSTWSS